MVDQVWISEVKSNNALGDKLGIYDVDEKTPLPSPFSIVNFGPFKDCFLPDASTNIEKLAAHWPATK